MRIAEIVFSSDGGQSADPPAWRALTALAGDALATGEAAAPGSVRANGARRVLSLAVDVPLNGVGPSDDLCLTFRGGFELRLGTCAVAGPARAVSAAARIDHVAVCVYPENLNAYADALCARLPAASCERYTVGTDESGMRIAAISEPSSGAHIVFSAPTGRAGQLADFLANTGCEGLQHVAFSVPSVRGALAALTGRGMRFIGASAGSADEAVVELREDGGYLRQAFTEPLWGEFFVEVLERNGISGLRASNIQSLYEINERGRNRVSDVSDAPDLRASG